MSIARRILGWISQIFASLEGEGVDSVEYVRRIEREFEIAISDRDAEEIRTVGELCDYVAQSLRARGRPADDETIWPKVRQITAEEFGVAESEITRQIRFVEDLDC